MTCGWGWKGGVKGQSNLEIARTPEIAGSGDSWFSGIAGSPAKSYLGSASLFR